MSSKNSVRELAYEAILKFYKENAFSNIIVSNTLNKSGLSPKDKALFTELVYGTISKGIQIDYIIRPFSKLHFERIDLRVKCVLRLAVYQILYLDKIPQSAACNEAVKIANKYINPGAGGFCNAILRSICREEANLFDFSPITDVNRRLSVEYSISEDIVKLFLSCYKRDFTEKLLKSFEKSPDIYITVNTLKTDSVNLKKSLETQGCSIKTTEIDNVLIVESNTSVALKSKEFENGHFIVQDMASVLSTLALEPKPKETVFDVCAAPGGKSFAIALLMSDNGAIKSFDISEKKLKLVKEGAEKLGISIIETKQSDGAKLNEELIEKANRVICDVPCSGLGIIAKKPDLRYKTTSDFERLPEVQYNILSNCSKYLKTGGTLVYSTCTVNCHENDEVVKKFIDNNTGFELIDAWENFPKSIKKHKKGMTANLYPHILGTDGFYIAKLVKRK